MVLQSLGFAAATGVALALVRKAGTVFWTSNWIFILTGAHCQNPGRVYCIGARAYDDLWIASTLNSAHRPARNAVSVLGTAVGVLLIVFTVGLAQACYGRTWPARIKPRAEIDSSGSSVGIGSSSPFMLPENRAEEISRIEGVRAATAIGQTLDRSDSGFGTRLIDGVKFDEYANLRSSNLGKAQS